MTRREEPPKDKKERTSWRQQRERLSNSKRRGPCNDKKRSTSKQKQGEGLPPQARHCERSEAISGVRLMALTSITVSS